MRRLGQFPQPRPPGQRCQSHPWDLSVRSVLEARSDQLARSRPELRSLRWRHEHRSRRWPPWAQSHQWDRVLPWHRLIRERRSPQLHRVHLLLLSSRAHRLLLSHHAHLLRQLRREVRWDQPVRSRLELRSRRWLP